MLALMLKAFRRQEEITLRALAKKIGIKHTCLFRFERGQQIESQALAKIINWILSTKMP